MSDPTIVPAMGCRVNVSKALRKHTGKPTYAYQPPPIVVGPQQLTIAESPQRQTRSKVPSRIDSVTRDPALRRERKKVSSLDRASREGEADEPCSCLFSLMIRC